jgi:hypothetical protein
VRRARLASSPALRGGAARTQVALHCLGFVRALDATLSCVCAPSLAPSRQLFAQLQSGARQSADPAAFAQCLALDSGQQQARVSCRVFGSLGITWQALTRCALAAVTPQDGQEFMKLLLSLVERSLEASCSGSVRGLVPRLFRGRVLYTTTCDACGGASAASATPVDVYELELNVKGVPTLAASLADFFAEEKLTGDNRYACDAPACGGARRDATRAVRLRSAPPFLNMQLKRFIFDMKARRQRARHACFVALRHE